MPETLSRSTVLRGPTIIWILPGFSENYYEPMHAACESGMLTLQFPWLWPLMNSLPDAIVLKLQPLLYMLIKFQRVSAFSIYESDVCVFPDGPSLNLRATGFQTADN
jgi:hypothetical protein